MLIEIASALVYSNPLTTFALRDDVDSIRCCCVSEARVDGQFVSVGRISGAGILRFYPSGF